MSDKAEAIRISEESLAGEIDRLKARLNSENASHIMTVGQRDRAEAAADFLADSIMGITGQDVGEQSSANCRWAKGIEMAKQYAGEREKMQARVSRLEEALNQALIHWAGHGVPPEEGAAYVECEKRLDETPDDALLKWEADMSKRESHGS